MGDFAACCLEKISCEEEVNNESPKSLIN